MFLSVRSAPCHHLFARQISLLHSSGRSAFPSSCFTYCQCAKSCLVITHTPFPPIFPLHPRCALYARIPVLPSRGGSKGVYHKTRGARIRRGLRCVVRVSRRDRGTEVGSCVPASRQQCRCRRVHVATRPPPPFVGRTTLVVSLGLSRRIVALFSLPSLSSQLSKHESLAKIG